MLEGSVLEWTVLILAGYLAGVLNSIAGGGSFLTFPCSGVGRCATYCG